MGSVISPTRTTRPVRLVLETFSEVQDDAGSVYPDWVEHSQPWCTLDFVSTGDSEAVVDDTTYQRRRGTVRFRWRPMDSSKARLRDPKTGTIYELANIVNENHSNRELIAKNIEKEGRNG